MCPMTADQFVEKHARRLKASVPDIRTGVQGVTEAPGPKAARAQDRMRAKLLEAIDSGLWGRRVSAVSVEQWRTAFLTKGIDRIATGIDQAAPIVKQFAEQLLPYIEVVKKEVDAMPNVTLEDSIARMTHQVRRMADFTFKR